MAEGIRRDDRDRQGRVGEMTGVVADRGKLAEMVPIADHDERPVLVVLRAAGPSSRIEDPLEVLVRDRRVAELPDHADGVDRVPGLHRSMIAHRTD